MKTTSRNNSLFILLCSLVFLTTACTSQETDGNQQGSQASSLVPILGSITDVHSLSIQTDEETVTLQSKVTGWESKELGNLDNAAIDEFLTTLASLQGTPVGETPAIEKLFEQPNTTVELDNGTDNQSLEIVTSDQETWVKKMDESSYYQLSDVSDILKDFDSAYLQRTIELAVSEPTEIQIASKDQSIVLNKETSMNDIETSPFISGWFLHGIYQTEFSIEYYKMEDFYTALTNFKGTEVDKTVGEDEATMILTLKDNKQEENLFIVQTSNDRKRYDVTVKSANKTYEVPAAMIDKFSFEPLAITDNFISILPLSSIQAIEIQQKDKTTLLTAQHELTVDEKDETVIHSTFYADGEILPEKSFRKTYQYLASLSYNAPLKDTEKAVGKTESEIQMTYRYLNNGKEETATIYFVPMTNDDKHYAVKKNDIYEFSTTKESVQKALDELNKLTE